MYDSTDLAWKGDRLRLHSGRVLATIEPDQDWPVMWRVQMPDGQFSDMANRTRAKDAAVTLALAALNGRQARTEPRPRAFSAGPLSVSLST
jgi:hypothetical protein